MEIDYLREFLVLAETRNYWEASERLYIGQSTLSKHIHHMEEELGISLFKRTTRHVELTAYGEKLIPYARSITDIRLAFLEQVRALKEEENGRLILGVIPSMVQYKITDLLVHYNSLWPDSLVKIIEADTSDLLSALRDGRCSMAFLRDSDDFPISDEEFTKLPYMSDTAAVILPASHPLAAEESVMLSQLKDERFIMLQETSILRRIFHDACMKAGFRPNIIFDCQRMDSIFDLVSKEMGISLIMDHHLEIPGKNIVKKPLVPTLESRVFLCYPKNARPNRAGTQLIKLIKPQDDKTTGL